jgi:phosphatidylinositol glycan class K
MIIITSHGGENFIKVRGKSVILSDELNRALNEMYIKERYKEILFILDTCEADSLFEYVDVPNVYFVASSLKHQKANSYSYDNKYMGPTTDKFHFKLFHILKRIHQEKSFKTAINSVFLEIKSLHKFLETDVAINNKIEREILFEDFFGNYLKKDHYNVKYDLGNVVKEYSEMDEKYSKNFYRLMNEERNKLDEEILEIKTFKEQSFSNLENSNQQLEKSDSQIKRELMNLKKIGSSGLIFFVILYMIIKLIKQ